MNLLQHVLRSRRAEQRYSLNEYIADTSFLYAGQAYAGIQQSYGELSGRDTERSASPFAHWVGAAYKANGVVFACQLARLLIFTEARFQFQQLRGGKPGDLFGTPDLALLENPWPNGSTGELLARMIQDVDLAGNAYIRRTGPLAEPRLERLRPDWVTIVLGDNPDLLTPEVLGYFYEPGGPGSGEDPIAMTTTEVAHWSPIPDPVATYRGMSWLTPVLREISADGAATDHKLAFFDHAATPNMIFRFPVGPDVAALERFKDFIENEKAGAANAYKNLYVGAGADVSVVGADFKQMDFKTVQGAGETRIAAAAGMHPVIVGLSEGLQGSSLNAGNFSAARRLVADKTMRPLWRTCCAALASIVRVPPGARLWTDTSDVAFLREDEKDAAEIEQTKASTISMLVREGFKWETVLAAVTAQDMSLLEHTGALSVQLLPQSADGSTVPSTNGKAPKEVNA